MSYHFLTPEDIARAVMSSGEKKPHLLHVVVDHQWVGYDIECPYGDDPERPCLGHDEDGTETPGCGVEVWCAEQHDPVDSLFIPRLNVAGPVPVVPIWDMGDECWCLYPWPEPDQPQPTASDVLEAMGKLVVTAPEDDPGSLQVDAKALMTSDYQVRFWALIQEPGGQWRHPEGGGVGPLGEALHSIALVYLNPYRPQEVQSGG